jgi:hypothetical protein
MIVHLELHGWEPVEFVHIVSMGVAYGVRQIQATTAYAISMQGKIVPITRKYFVGGSWSAIDDHTLRRLSDYLTQPAAPPLPERSDDDK